MNRQIFSENNRFVRFYLNIHNIHIEFGNHRFFVPMLSLGVVSKTYTEYVTRCLA